MQWLINESNTRNNRKLQIRLNLMFAPVAERLRALFLNHSIMSPLCLVWVRGPALATCETSKILLAGESGVFSRGSLIIIITIMFMVGKEMYLTFNTGPDCNIPISKVGV